MGGRSRSSSSSSVTNLSEDARIAADGGAVVVRDGTLTVTDGGAFDVVEGSYTVVGDVAADALRSIEEVSDDAFRFGDVAIGEVGATSRTAIDAVQDSYRDAAYRVADTIDRTFDAQRASIAMVENTTREALGRVADAERAPSDVIARQLIPAVAITAAAVLLFRE